MTTELVKIVLKSKNYADSVHVLLFFFSRLFFFRENVAIHLGTKLSCNSKYLKQKRNFCEIFQSEKFFCLLTKKCMNLHVFTNL